MEQVLKPLAGHQVLLVLLQLAALLSMARVGSEVVRRMGLPSVVGELMAGILLGPSVFGHFFPGAFAHLFPPDPMQYHLLEIVSTLGMVFLLLLTGVETDLKLLKHLGRPAMIASVFGMVVPFVFGFGLGWWMPERYVAAPQQRMLFALFLATALSISAMPVIAKILMDLDLTRRNIGVVILSAGVVDDTTGWLILSLIAGAAQGGAGVSRVVLALIGTGIFLVATRFVFYPVVRVSFRVARDQFLSKETDLVFMVVVTLLFAAVTDWIGIHAVFGAFVAGCMIRQVPRLSVETLHKLESVTFSIFAPIFFGLVGLKVDLWKLGSGRMLWVVLGIATAGKLIGCTAGSLLGGLRFWESLSIAVAMNARGAMELVVATIGLSLGLLNQEMYSIVVMVAVLTSFMAPVGLRLTMKMVRMTEEEADRIASESAKGLFDPEKLRVLVPTSGGKNALHAARIALFLARHSANPVCVLYVEKVSTLVERWLRRFRRSVTGQNLSQHLERIKTAATDAGFKAPETRRQVARDVAVTIDAEAAKGYDMILVGAGGSRRGIRGDMLEELVDHAPCHVAIVKHRGPEEVVFRRLLVPIDGSFLSRVAIEFAVRQAEGMGDGAEVTIAYVNERQQAPPFGAPEDARDDRTLVALTLEGGLEKLSPVFRATKVKTNIMTLEKPSDEDPILEEAASGKYDLIVLGAENRAIHNRMFFGHRNERLIDQSQISVVLVVPKFPSEAVH